MINKAFLELMIEGDCNGTGFQYPIPTYSITKDFDWSETPNNKLLFEMTAKYGTPYFSNYINSDMKPSDVRSMCCRLRLDLRELRRRNGGFFGSGESTGSIGVVTINMPRIGYLSTSREDFYARLDHMMDVAARSLKLKREKVSDYLNRGLYPYTKYYLGTFENHFSTIGLVGMNEACLNAKWLGKDLTNEEAQAFTEEVLDHMRERLADYQEQYAPDLYNLEATPAESTAYRLAKHDKEMYPDIITAGTQDSPYYTNSSHCPVWFSDNVLEALDIQDKFQPKYTSGTVFHTFLGERLPNYQSAMKLVRKICENYTLPYITLSPTYSVCPEHGYIAGEHPTCPQCGAQTQVWSRITGYYRPVQNWNIGKAQEFKERQEYSKFEKSFRNEKNSTTAVVTNSEEKKAEEPKVEENCETCSIDYNVPENKEAVKADFTDSSKVRIVTSPTCPNCPRAKKALKEAGIEYEEIDVTTNADKLKEMGIMSAPTLIVGEKIISGVGPIVGWIKNQKAQNA
jgi:ribonucleoside-triphosphate reductase (formate)